MILNMKMSCLKYCAGLLVLGSIFYPVSLKAEEPSRVLLEVTGELAVGDITLKDGSLLDSYPFEITSEAPLLISVESSDFDGYFIGLILIDANMKKVDDNISSLNVGILINKSKMGKYEVLIISPKPNMVGKYKLKVEIPHPEKLQAESFFNQGQTLFEESSQKSLLEAIKSFENALSFYQKLNDPKKIIVVLNRLGLIYNDLGEKNKALDYFQQALPLSIAVESRYWEANTLNNIGTTYDDLGEKNKALGYYQQALSLKKAVGDRSAEATILNNIGSVYKDLGEKNKALDYFQQSLLLSRVVRNRSAEATILNNIGAIYDDLGEKNKALDYYQQALPLRKEVGDRSGEATTLSNIGVIYNNLEKKDKALDYYKQSLLLKKAVGDRSGEAVILNNIGLVYDDLGEKDKALDYFQQSLALEKEVGDQSGEAVTLNNIGGIYADLGENKKALDYLQKALTLSKIVGDRSGEAVTLNNIGGIYADLGENKKALNYYQQSLALNKEIGDQSSEANTLNNIGGIYFELGEKDKALDYLQKALILKRIIGDRSGEATSLNNIGLLLFENQEYAQASQYVNQSIELSESISQQDLTDQLKVSYFDTYEKNYRLLQNILIAQNQPIAALEVAERGRARALVDLLNKRFSAKTEVTSLEKPTINQLKNIAKTHNSTLITYSLIPAKNSSGKWTETHLYIYLVTPDGKVEFRSVDLTANNLKFPELIKAARQFVTTRPPSRPDSTRSTNQNGPYNLDYFSVGDYVKLQGEFPTDEPWRVIALNRANQTLTLDQSLRETPLTNVSPSRIASKTDTSLQQLHQLLIDPIASLLPRNPEANVIFIPQGALFGIPFPALQDTKGQFLIEKHTILTAPSIQVLAQTAQQNQRLAKQTPTTNQALIVGNPYPYPKNLNSLENAAIEAQKIGNLLGATPLLGKEATEAKVLAQMPKADILHFATHASFNDQEGLRSAIFLTAEPNAPDDDLFQTPGRITAEEIFNQFEKNPLNAKIVVLSACDTGQGEITGDGVIGLSRSLIAAGVPSVLVSLWSVNDSSTEKLMTEFYHQWQQKGVDKATALRNAMLQIKEAYPEPYYWSAFTLIGEAQ